MQQKNPHTIQKKNEMFLEEIHYDFMEADEAPRKMTVEQLRKHKEYENVTEDEAQNIIDTLHKLSILAYFYYVTFDNCTQNR